MAKIMNITAKVCDHHGNHMREVASEKLSPQWYISSIHPLLSFVCRDLSETKKCNLRDRNLFFEFGKRFSSYSKLLMSHLLLKI